MIKENDIDIAHLMSMLKTFISSKIYTILISLLIVLIGVFSLNFIKPKEYSSKIVISSNQYPYSISREILNELAEAVENKEYDLLNRKLGIKEGDISVIKKINLSEVRLDINEKLKSAISLDLIIKSNANRVRMDSVIVHFMNKIAFVQENVDSKKRALDNYINNISGQINRLDSTQLYLINKLSSTNQNMNIENFDLGTIYQQMIFMNNELNISKEQLDNLVEFKVVSFIEATSKPLLWKYINMGLIVWAIFLMFLFVRYIW